MMPAPIDFAAVALGVAERGWRPFPGWQETKVPAMRGWPGLNEAEWDCSDLIAVVDEYQPAGLYCCCLAVQPEIVAVDIDITNREHPETAAKLADDHLGKTPLVRIGFAPKCARIYRNGGGVRSRKLHPLELYSGSGQIVGFGWHQKAGRPYLWPNASPLDLNADSAEIPPVTQAQLNCFTNELFKFVPRRHHAGCLKVTIMTKSTFPPALRKQICDLLAAGGQISREGATVVVDGPREVAAALLAAGDQLDTSIVPSVTPDGAALVRNLLAEVGASIAYITDPALARNAVADIRASQPEVIGLDVETEVLPLFRQPRPVAFNKDGNPAARQPRDGARPIPV
jgi:hypothetical protein